jgi:hypothetical protein
MTDKKNKIDKVTAKLPCGTRDRLRKAGKLYPNMNGSASISNAVRKYIEAGLKKDGV